MTAKKKAARVTAAQFEIEARALIEKINAEKERMVDPPRGCVGSWYPHWQRLNGVQARSTGMSLLQRQLARAVFAYMMHAHKLWEELATRPTRHDAFSMTLKVKPEVSERVRRVLEKYPLPALPKEKCN